VVVVREAVEDDLDAIVQIYNASILTTTTWADRPQTIAERRSWFHERRAHDDGVLVATEASESETENVVGFAAYGEFRDNTLWPGYRFTVENTVHVRDDRHGRGIGRLLMDALCSHAADRGKHVMVAAVDAENDGSVRFHEALGFVEVGRMPQIGWKFDRWLDLVLLQKQLAR
jgi:L-amino acid N-acyltransferase YncA